MSKSNNRSEIVSVSEIEPFSNIISAFDGSAQFCIENPYFTVAGFNPANTDVNKFMGQHIHQISFSNHPARAKHITRTMLFTILINKILKYIVFRNHISQIKLILSTRLKSRFKSHQAKEIRNLNTNTKIKY